MTAAVTPALGTAPAQAPAAAAHATQGWLARVPAPVFAPAMGVAGLGLCWRDGEGHWPQAVPHGIGDAVLASSGVLLAVAVALYAAKLVLHLKAVRLDLAHPAQAGLLGQLPVALLLLAEAALPHARPVAAALACAGAVLGAGLMLVLARGWVLRSHAAEHLGPAWLIPVIALLMVPLVGVRLGAVEASWAMFSAGLFAWLALLPLLAARLMFHDPLPARAQPTLAILVAPPAVAFLAYLVLQDTGAGPPRVDGIARLLFYAAAATGILMATLVPRLLRTPFGLSWWAFTMPLAALVLTLFAYADLTANATVSSAAAVGLGIITLSTGFVAARTLIALLSGRLIGPGS